MTQDVEIQPVDATYRHYEKAIVSHGVVRPNDSRLKWYDIASAGKSISASTRNLAQNFLEDQAALTSVPGTNELGFVLLHRCGESFYFLLLCTWRNSNELWETVFYLDVEKMEGFALFPQREQHKGAFCVWEMGVVTYETRVWAQYLMSARKLEDENTYLLSSSPGEI